MNLTKSLRLLILSFALVAGASAAEPPGILNHQGRINADGSPFNGAGSFKFALVDGAGTTSFWSNDGTSTTGDEPAAAVPLTVSGGRYSVALGETSLANMSTAIPASVFADNADVRLRVWFDDGTNGSQLLSPDQRLGAVGYALAAGSVDAAQVTGTLAAGQLPSEVLLDGASGVSLSGSFAGDGSGLTGTGDDLGNHTATQTLDLGGNDVSGAGTVTATAFVGDGSGLTGIDLGAHTATQTLALGGNDVSGAGTVTATAFVGDGSGLTGTGDGLGNHTATQTLNLAGNYLSGDGGAEGLFVDANGRVGIGLNSPTKALEVAGDIRLNAADPGITFYDGTGLPRQSSIQTVFKTGAVTPPYTAADQEMSFNVSNNVGTGTTQVMTLLGDGSVGIGSTAPQTRLEVEDTVPEIRLTDGRGDYGSATGAELGKLSWYSRDGSNGGYAPVAGIEIVAENGTVAPDGRFLFRTGTNSEGLTTRMVIANEGDIGIGTTSPTEKLHVIGNILASGTITGASDRHVKENFSEVDPREVLERVSAMPIQRWNYIGEDVTHIGPVAQDFHGAFEVGIDDKHISMVDADGVALAAIQGLNQKLDEKDAEISELKETVAELKQLVEAMAKEGGRQ